MKKKWKTIFVISLILNLSIVYIGYKALEYRGHINEFLNKYRYVVDEFSGRNNYLEENLHFQSDSTVPGRSVFLGTQLTANWELLKYFPRFEVFNRGIVGQRYSGYLLRFRTDVINLAPQAVVIEFSSYNFRPESQIEEFKEYTQSLTELARQNNIIPILTTVVPVGADFDVEMEVPYNIADSIIAYNNWMRHYCQYNRIEYVDYYNLLVDSLGNFNQQYLANQIQPNRAGYKLLSDQILETFQKIGVSPAK